MRVKTSISLVIGDEPELVLTADEARRIYSALKDIFDPRPANFNQEDFRSRSLSAYGQDKYGQKIQNPDLDKRYMDAGLGSQNPGLRG